MFIWYVVVSFDFELSVRFCGEEEVFLFNFVYFINIFVLFVFKEVVYGFWVVKVCSY